MPPLSPPSPDDLAMKHEYEVERVGIHTIAKRRGLTSSKVVCALERAHVKLRRRAVAYQLRRARGFPGHDVIKSAYDRLGSVAGTCRDLRLTYETVTRSLRASGVQINPGGGRWKYPADKRAEIVAYAKQRRLREAAKHYGMNRSTVFYYRQEARRPSKSDMRHPHPCEGCNFLTTDGRLCDRCQIAT